jgi:putative transposase
MMDARNTPWRLVLFGGLTQGACHGTTTGRAENTASGSPARCASCSICTRYRHEKKHLTRMTFTKPSPALQHAARSGTRHAMGKLGFQAERQVNLRFAGFITVCMRSKGSKYLTESPLRAWLAEEQIIHLLHQAEPGEQPIGAVCREHGMSAQTFSLWRQRCGGMTVSNAQRWRELEKKNARLKRLRAERDLEVDALKV